MTFAVPAFLLAVLAGAIPLVLHMIHTQRAEEVRFSTLRFLRASVQRTRRRKYLEDVALLSLRVLALVLIAIGLSRPAISGLRALWGSGTPTAVAIVLDNSASMALLDGGTQRFETARRAVENLLDGLREGDAVALLPTGGPAAPELGKLVHTHETVRQALGQCRVSGEKADLAARLREARALLSGADAIHRAVYVITDNQALSWKGLTEDDADPRARDMPLVLVNVGRDPAPNVALGNLRLESPALTVGVPIGVSVEVRNTSALPQQRHVELHVDGSREGVSAPLSLPPGGTTRQEFHFSVDRGGAHRGEVRLAEEDGSALDNRVHFALAVDQRISVAVLKPRRHEIAYADDAFYLERALAPTGGDGWAIRVTTLTPEQLTTEPLGKHAVIWCVNLPALVGPAVERLHDYVWDGGHLVWVCGPNVQPGAYNQMDAQSGHCLLPLPLDSTPQAGETRRIGFLDRDHSALAPLAEPASLYQSVLVHRHLPVTWPPGADARLLARLDDGKPLLTWRRVGSGSVLFLGTALQAEWTNLPLRPIFLPLVARLTFHLAGAEAARSQGLAGAPLVVPAGAMVENTEVEVVRPSGEVLRVPGPAKAGEPFRYADTHDAGVYLLRSTDPSRPKQWAFAVNPDPEEADAATTPVEELRKKFGKEPVLVCEGPNDVASTLRRLREGQGIWEVFLAAVLAGLVLEAYLANRRGGRTETPVPSASARTAASVLR
jgi:hypothetical protein